MNKYENCNGCPHQPNCMYLYMRCVEWCEMWQPGQTYVSTSSEPVDIKIIPLFKVNRLK